MIKIKIEFEVLKHDGYKNGKKGYCPELCQSILNSRFLTTVINIILLRFILKKPSSHEMGLWYVFTSFGSLAILTEFGFSTTIPGNVTFIWCGDKEISKEGFSQNTDNIDPNYYLLFKLIRTSKTIYLILVFIGITTLGIFL